MTDSSLSVQSGCPPWQLQYGQSAGPTSSVVFTPVPLGIGEVSGCLTNATISIGDFTLENFATLAVSKIDAVMADEGTYMR